jgi:hypothetical protein
VSESQAESEQLVEELRKASVADMLAHTCSLLGSIAYGKLSKEVGDLNQARLAIDALKALAPLLDDARRREVQQLIANLQLAYADAAASSG